MRSSDVLPTTVKDGGDAPPSYFHYLTTPEWRRRRNAALRRAGWSCRDCRSRRDLQVHHLTYARLGHERDDDLAVLCVACHERQHPAEAAHEYVRHYLRLAREVLTDDKPDTLPDFTEALKVRCARTGLYYNSEKLARAIWLVWNGHVDARPRHGTFVAGVDFVAQQWRRPPSRAEARQILRNVGALDAAEHVKTMPPATFLLTTQRERDRQTALDMVAREIQASLDRCAALERVR